MSVAEYIAQRQSAIIGNLTEGKKIDDFKPGDTISVRYKIVDGSASERITGFEGICTKKRNKGIMSSFVLRKISSGIGVERTFLTYSPLIVQISLVRHGVVRRAVLNYLRNVRGAMKVRERFPKKKSAK